VKPDSDEIKSLISQREGYNLEFKESFSNSIAKEMCAFANASGGKLLLGVSDEGEIRGITISNVMISRIYDVARNSDPLLRINVSRVHNVLVIDVPKGTDKPYSVNGKFYVRDSTNYQQLKRDEIRRFFQEESLILFDEKLNYDFDLEKNFDEVVFGAFLETTRMSPVLEKDDILKNLGLLKDGYLKNAGVLLFCKKINTEYIIKGGPGEEKLELPESALREAILNAIAHRNYFLNANIQVYIFSDRVEIANPGGLPPGMSYADLGKKSMPRNFLLFGLMQRMGLVEKVGTGILRMNHAMKEYNLEKPVMEADENWFTIIFRRPELERASFEGREKTTPQKTTQKTTQKILGLIKENPDITRRELASIIGISEDGIKYHLTNLKNMGLLERIGHDKGGYWRIVDNDE